MDLCCSRLGVLITARLLRAGAVHLLIRCWFRLPRFSDHLDGRLTMAKVWTYRTEISPPPSRVLFWTRSRVCYGGLMRGSRFVLSNLRLPLSTHGLRCNCRCRPLPYISPPPGSMCFGVKATDLPCLRCLGRIPKLLTASSMYSHLTVLENHATAHANTPAFKLPHASTLGGSAVSVEAWVPVEYRRFRDDIEHFARYWMTTFQRAGIAPRSCIGIW